MYLAMNSLQRLPVELWTLDSLRVLSLRNNNLEYLPPSIARLRNLGTLNLACNQLRWLPWELKSLFMPEGRLLQLTAMPNPLLRAFDLPAPDTNSNFIHFTTERALFEREAQVEAGLLPEHGHTAAGPQLTIVRHVYSEYAKRMSDNFCDFSNIAPIYTSRTSVLYYRDDGSLALPPAPDHWSNSRSNVATSLETTDCDTPRSHHSRVPSLLELAAQSTLSLPPFPDLQELLGNPAPSAILRALETVEQVRREEGERVCSVCGRRYIIPRTAWIEFWHRVPVNIEDGTTLPRLSMNEMVLPFLRKGCSWGCVG